MAKISGVPVENISGIYSIPVSTIQSIGGIATADIPGWPGGGGPSCTIFTLGYSDGRRQPPSDACIRGPQNYDFDSVNGLLYTSGGCGTTFAVAGYYSDGREIYFWDGAEIFTSFSACKK